MVVIVNQGFDYVKERVVHNRDCDNAVKVAFGSGLLTKEPEALDILKRYVTELKSDTLLLADEEQFMRQQVIDSTGL
jgi:hypothetical protein